MEISGKIITVCEPKTGVSARSGKSWKAQDFVIETLEEQPQSFVFNVFGEERINEFNIQAGESVTVDIHFEAKEYNGRWFNSLSAFSISRKKENKKKKKKETVLVQEPEDELPF